MPQKVLILSVSAGSGHVKAAEALEKVFRQQKEVVEVVNIDVLKFTNKLFRDFYSKLYFQLVEKAPTFLGWWYKMSDEPWKTDKMRLMLDRLNTSPLVDFIAEFNPDITVSTHFLPAAVISHLIATGKLEANHSIVVTDFDFHAMWLSRLFHRYFVALEEAKVHLVKLGLPGDRITVSGIPIDPVYQQKFSRDQVRRELDLRIDEPVVLISAGALGVSPVEAIVEQFASYDKPIQLVVICGKNSELQKKMEERLTSLPTLAGRTKLLGYTTEMHRWMASADLLIGKPGGLTTSEALASGLPMVIVAPIPGQEERNSDHLLEKGIAIKCNEFTTLTYKVGQILDAPLRLAAMRENALKYAHPQAALTIARTLMKDELMHTRPFAIDEAKQREILDNSRGLKTASPI